MPLYPSGMNRLKDSMRDTAAAAVPVNSINREDGTAILLEDGTELLLEA